MLYVETVLKNKRRFIDIGCNVGIYSYHFLRRMQYVEAFEPVEEISARLKPFLSDTVKLHNCALSDSNACLDLFIPHDENGDLVPSLASLEVRDSGSVEVRKVPVKRLDEFEFSEVDLIKIDVEGHEASVLRGSCDTIARWKPVLLIEIEQRHINCDINDVFQQILDFGYVGKFVSQGSARKISEFRYEDHQAPFLDNVMSNKYINNFVFVPA
jgi:FkbM family methyltransferase